MSMLCSNSRTSKTTLTLYFTIFVLGFLALLLPLSAQSFDSTLTTQYFANLTELYNDNAIYNAGPTGHQYDLSVGYRHDQPIMGSILHKALNKIPESATQQWFEDLTS